MQQRGEQADRWIKLTIMQAEANRQPLQSATTVLSDGRRKGPQHHEEGVRMAARALGLESTEAHRLASIGGMSAEAKAGDRYRWAGVQAVSL